MLFRSDGGAELGRRGETAFNSDTYKRSDTVALAGQYDLVPNRRFAEWRGM